MGILWSVFSTDPLLHLTEVVADHILEFVDDDTLLTCRLVCKRWSHEIINRNWFWKKRCERLGAHDDPEAFPSDTDFFRVTLNIRWMFRQLSSREGWQVHDNCDGSQCDFHKKAADYCQRDNWVPELISDIKQKERTKKTTFVCTKEGELIALDENKREVTWRTQKRATEIFHIVRNYLVAITRTGDIEVYSMTGGCTVRETNGQLRGVHQMYVHPTKPAIVMRLENDQLFLVNREMQLFLLDIPSPQLPAPEGNEESPSTEGIADLTIKVEVEFSDELLAMVVQRKSSMSFVIFTTNGEIVHRVVLKCQHVIAWHVPLAPEQGKHKCVCVIEGHVVAHAIHFRSDGIAVAEIWKKALPTRCADWPIGSISAGKKFLLAHDNNGGIQLYRMDDGSLAADFPIFTSSAKKKVNYFPKAVLCLQHKAKIVKGVGMSEARTKKRYKKERRPQKLYLTNTDWLDGLSPTTMDEDFPVGVIFSKEHLQGRCLRWTEGLWGTIALTPEPELETDELASSSDEAD
ncbi:hypothetical protein ACOMHN_022004 [Nucella lapillus]